MAHKAPKGVTRLTLAHIISCPVSISKYKDSPSCLKGKRRIPIGRPSIHDVQNDLNEEVSLKEEKKSRGAFADANYMMECSFRELHC